jgi:transposase-like protein
MTDLTNPAFTDETKAREFLEASRWPDGPVCPHCGQQENVSELKGKSMGPGWYHCNDCREKFTVRVGTLYERSHIPLHKWLLATHLIISSKKGMSAHQLHHMLGITYKSAWFMAHRIREAMTNPKPGPIGGEHKVIEADETYVGSKAENRAFARKLPKKHAVMSLVERDGEARTFHLPRVTSKTLRTTIVQLAGRKSLLMTDEASFYVKLGKEFAAHETVTHSDKEYVRKLEAINVGFIHTNTVENYFSILKRGIYGVYHHVSEAHLQRYLAEFDFRYNNRKISDAARAAKALKGIEGKRLTYRRPDQTAHA